MLKKLWIVPILMFALIQSQTPNAVAEEYDISKLLQLSGGFGSYAAYYTACLGQHKMVIKDNNLFLVKFEDSHVYLYKSEDRGLTFGPKVRVDNMPDTEGSIASIPSMTLDDVGNIYVAYAGRINYDEVSVYISKSSDDGQTFTPGVRVNNLPGMPGTGYWSPIVEVDSNKNIYISWGKGSNWVLNIFLAKSTDGGQTFNIKTVANYYDSDPDLSGTKFNPNIVIGRNGEVYLAWVGNSRTIFLKSEDGGNTFVKNVLDVNATGAVNVALDQDGNIYIVWIHVVSPIPGFYATRIWFSKSEDNGNTFFSPVEVASNITLTGGINLQYAPNVIVDRYKRIYVTWSEGVVSGGRRYDSMFLSRSSDGGVNFDPVTGSVASGDVISSALDSESNLYVLSVDWNYNYLTKVSPKDMIQPASSLISVDTPCDNGGSIVLTWTLSPDDPAVGTGSNKVTGYNVYRSDISSGPIGTVVAGISNFTDNSAANGIAYYYTVRATDGTKESADSNVASAASSRNLPLPPTNVTAIDTPYDFGGSITLSWTKSADDGGGLNNVANYDIYRYSATDGNIRTLASLPAGTIGYVDNTASGNETYFYYVKAYDKNCSNGSGASNIAEGSSINNFTALPGFISTLPGISSQLLKSLTSKVENAIASFESGNTAAAVNKLNALLNEISAQSGKGIEPSTAQILANYVQNLVAYINAH